MMAKSRFLITFILLLLTEVGLSAEVGEGSLVAGAARLPEYIHLLEGRRVGVLANHTSRIDDRHLVDTLLASGVDVQLIFAPEGGFRGDAVERHRDSYLGIEIITLRERPRTNDVFRCDVIVCDLQDEGLRTSLPLKALVRLMRVCGDIGVPLILLDNPNPRGSGVDGAIVEAPYRTSEEILPLPLLHGMTLGELARMINGEGWLAEGGKCPLTVVPCLNLNAHHNDTSEVASCGLSLEVTIAEGSNLDLSRVVEAYGGHKAGEEEFFVGDGFDRQIGASYVRDMIELGYTASEIESMWSGDVERFCAQREQYLIYE